MNATALTRTPEPVIDCVRGDVDCATRRPGNLACLGCFADGVEDRYKP